MACSGNLAAQVGRSLHWCPDRRRAFGPPGSALIFQAAGALGLPIAEIADLRETAPARLLGHGLLTFTLFLAINAQRRHRPRQQPPERDGLAALLADVDLVVLQ